MEGMDSVRQCTLFGVTHDHLQRELFSDEVLLGLPNPRTGDQFENFPAEDGSDLCQALYWESKRLAASAHAVEVQAF